MKYLVDEGYTVVVAVRTQSAADFIISKYPGKVTAVIVPDIEKPGAYDKAVVGVDGLLHMASPVQFSWEDPKEVIGPAVNGATGILKSVANHGAGIKRVVLTSSSVAIVSPAGQPDQVYDESGWNTGDVETVEKSGKAANPWLVYNASKTLAEKAAWDFVASLKPEWDLVAINPVFNFGPFIHDASGSKGVGSTPGILVSTFGGPDTSGGLAGDLVDVRDSAYLHVLALKTQTAGGQRILAVADSPRFAWQDLYDLLNQSGYKGAPIGNPGAGYLLKREEEKKGQTTTNGNAHRLFPGFKFRDIREIIPDMGADLKRIGVLH